MCDPVSMSVVALTAGAASGGLGAFGAITQGNAAAKAAQFNATTSADQAAAASNAAQINEQQTYRQGDQLEGQARATMGANGIDVNKGSALAVQQQIGTRTGQNVANEDYNTKLTQWGALNQSNLDTAQAGFDKQAGQISAVGSLLSSASQVSGKWAGYQQQGIL